MRLTLFQMKLSIQATCAVFVGIALLISGCGDGRDIALEAAEGAMIRGISDHLAAGWCRAEGKTPNPEWDTRLEASRSYLDRCLTVPLLQSNNSQNPDAWLIVINHDMPSSRKADILSVWICAKASDEQSRQRNKSMFAIIGSKDAPFDIDLNGDVIAQISGLVHVQWSDLVRIHRIIRQAWGGPLMPGTFEDIRSQIQKSGNP